MKDPRAQTFRKDLKATRAKGITSDVTNIKDYNYVYNMLTRRLTAARRIALSRLSSRDQVRADDYDAKIMKRYSQRGDMENLLKYNTTNNQWPIRAMK